MYKTLRHLASAVFPRSFLLRNEELIRWPYAVCLRGSECYCNICDHRLRRFIELDNGDSLCPFCGSSSRNRRLWQLFDPNEAHGRILHFSPARPLYRRLKPLLGDRYVSTDFECQFLAQHSYDITSMPESDNSFDTVICFHILEHIEDDENAISELHRVLKPGGVAFIQTPFRDGETYENPAVKTPAARLVHFEQEDHVRVYSVEGLTQRLTKHGFDVTVDRGKARDSVSLGLSKDEVILTCIKLRRAHTEKAAA